LGNQITIQKTIRMLKTVTLEDEEIEILLSHHKQKLADLAKEIQTLSEKQQFSEARLRDLTGAHEKEDEASIEEHLSDVVEIQDDGTLTVAAAHEAEEHVEEVPVAEAAHEEETAVAEASHEPEAVIEHGEETAATESVQEAEEHEEETPVAEVVHEHEEETPVAETSTEPEAAHEEETPAAEISHEPETVPHKGTFTIASE
jgi:hypothetical protein